MTSPYQETMVVGGAGFIGSNLTRRLLDRDDVERVVVYDNFTSGRHEHLQIDDPRLRVIEGDVHDTKRLMGAMVGATTVVHLASNPDIARAIDEPTIDFTEGTELTHRVLEAARQMRVGLVIYASGSGVYGDCGEKELSEDHGPLVPVSTYGASKLAGEGLVSSYAHLFGVRGRVFRFGNVVGPNQTHGVGYDFVHRLQADPSKLEILGDGTQSKSYVHVEDVIDAVLLASDRGDQPFGLWNVATGDYITVTDIAQLVIDELDLTNVKVSYRGGDRGWKGDVPIVRLNTDRIRACGWTNHYNSAEAIRAAVRAMIEAR